MCPLTQYEVYIDHVDVIYDAALNQTNASSKNKFYCATQLESRGTIGAYLVL